MRLAFLMAVAASLFWQNPAIGAEGWTMRPVSIPTRWAASVGPGNALPDYPRPQMVRHEWINLNGLWDYAITAKDAAPPEQYDGRILVPFPLEAALSGVAKPLRPDQLLWYRRTVASKPRKAGERTLLHFGAVDYAATVYLNGREVGAHSGGYLGFTIDIGDVLKPGDNQLVVKVWDPSDRGPNPHGKQSLSPQQMTYTPSSGIWQTVWLETVPATYIAGLTIAPDVDHGELHLTVKLAGPQHGISIEAVAKNGEKVVSRLTFSDSADLSIIDPHLWSPDDPFLYGLDIRLLKDGKPVDQVKSYFGLRKVEVRKDEAGIDRIFLNGHSAYNLGLLDQGFWPDGLYTAPTDAALKFDIQAAKAMGFNTIRKHIKIEPERWYYYCDMLGMLVWQDMVPPANATPEARAEFEKEMGEGIDQLYDHPSITTWVLFNEGWGAYDQPRLGHWLKRRDPSRLLDSHTGPWDQGQFAKWIGHLDLIQLSRLRSGDAKLAADLEATKNADPVNWAAGDMTDFHHYPEPAMPPAERGKARVVGEHGGIGAVVDGHLWNDLTPGSGYVQVSPDQVAKSYSGIVDQLADLQAKGLSGSIYTQPYDVEQEQNGLMTYDRAVAKIPVEEIARLNSRLVPKAKNYDAAVKGFSIAAADPRPQADRYAALLDEYAKGRQDLPFLRHLTLMAIAQKDDAHAAEAAGTFIARSAKPYSRETWAFIAATTQASADTGFALLRSDAVEADAALGENVAEIKVRDIIGREEVRPHLSAKNQPSDWAALEESVAAKYGVLGAEAAYGLEMAYFLSKQDWPQFGKYYALYYATAQERSQFPIGNLSYSVLLHVDDLKVLESAIVADRYYLDSIQSFATGFGRNDPTQIDTYARLLYKGGRTQDAITWEKKAVALAEGRDPELVDTLSKMQAGQPAAGAP